jgi:plasmid maintenance system antidote protein VapI
MSKTLADSLRLAIRESGQSATALADKTGVPQPTITRFLAGADMKLETAGRIAKHLGLELKTRKRAK